MPPGGSTSTGQSVALTGAVMCGHLDQTKSGPAGQTEWRPGRPREFINVSLTFKAKGVCGGCFLTLGVVLAT